MTTLDPIERMFQAGLQIYPADPEYVPRIAQRLRSGVVVPYIRYCTVELPRTSVIHDEHEAPSRTELGLTISWSFEDNAWIVAIVEGHGALAPGDFICAFPNFDAVTEAVLQYYFGVPTSIDGWVVPLHRHPELAYERVQAAIEQARVVPRAVFDTIQAELEAEAELQFPESDWDQALAGSFLQLRHQTDAHRTCALLRNAAQAYIVTDEDGGSVTTG